MATRIDELTAPPVVGQFYEVPCLIPLDHSKLMSTTATDRSQLENYSTESWISEMRPVLLPGHSDPELELGLPIPHYHIDLRFLSDERLYAYTKFLEAQTQRTFTVSELMLAVNAYLLADLECIDDLLLRWTPLECYREMPEFPGGGYHNPPAAAYLESFVGQPLVDGRCPHKGMQVICAPRLKGKEGGDIVVCPGHGLIIDLNRGCVIGTRAKEYKVKISLLWSWISWFFVNHWLRVMALEFEILDIVEITNSSEDDEWESIPIEDVFASIDEDGWEQVSTDELFAMLEAGELV